jgi:carbamoyltransferase
VSNNHHFRVIPFEKRIDFYRSINYVPDDYGDFFNRLPSARHMELSHHLAHAWSCVGTAPFSDGLIVVMDGMGESYRAMFEDISGMETSTGDYMHDLKLLKASRSEDKEAFVGVPTSLAPASGYREAETAYYFDAVKGSLRPVFKRWSRERSPPELYNHGFENMESLGAIYSRVSAHLLGDWNACGKVMGLAPWADKTLADAEPWVFGEAAEPDSLRLGADFFHRQQLMSGNPYDEGSFQVHWDTLEGLTNPNRFSPDRFGECASVAASVQQNLEDSALALVSSLRNATGANNLALCGGVALNSVLNGRIQREMEFDHVYVPPAPGDEGVAVGCALYGLHRLREEEHTPQEQAIGEAVEAQSVRDGELGANDAVDAVLPILQTNPSQCQGRGFGAEEVDAAIGDWLPWITCDELDSQEEVVTRAAAALSKGQVIAWFQGRSEFGQRALGRRSILADPRDSRMLKFVNQCVKGREWYRPLAPSVLDEDVGDWFAGLDSSANQSPYMSVTADLLPERRAQVPSVCHVDGSARLQTVDAKDSPTYHALISEFKRITKCPMLLNTSFNKKGQPIAESPSDAIQTLLSCGGAISRLFIGNWEIVPREFPLSVAPKQEAPAEADRAKEVYARNLYLTEVVSSPNLSDDPVRIRVQGGREDAGATPAEQGWTEFPSNLHLEIMQLLQALQPGAEDEGPVAVPPEEPGLFGTQNRYTSPEAEIEETPPVTVQELFEALVDVRADDPGLTWEKVRTALRWLHSEMFIYFQDPDEDFDADPSKLFEGLGVTITDLRE